VERFAIKSNIADMLPSRPRVPLHLPDHLLLQPTDGQPNIHVVISTFSGTQKAEAFFEDALKPLLDELNTPPYQVHRTESPDTISQFARHVILPRANDGIKQLVILLSGDGGIVDLVNVLREENVTGDAAIPTVALIPMGTGNALFHSSCRARPSPTSSPTNAPYTAQPFGDQSSALLVLLHGTPKPLPTLRVTFSPGSTYLSYPSSSSTAALDPISTPLKPPSPSTSSEASGHSIIHGCVLTSWCLHASLVSLSDHPTYRQKGSSRFATAAQSLLYPADGSQAHLYKGVVSTLHYDTFSGQEEWRPITDGSERVRREHMYVLCTLVSNLEENFNISPSSKPLDGKLRLVSIGAVPVEEVVRVLGLAYQGGKHVSDDESGDGKGVVGYEVVKGLRIEFEEDEGMWRRVCVDGKIFECPKGGLMEVRRNEGRELCRLVVP
jgi:Diacylglycerol kinase catalytic domain